MAYLCAEGNTLRSKELIFKPAHRKYFSLMDTHSAHTVFPADVWADTSTDWLLSMHRMASRWKGSSMKGYSCIRKAKLV